jgi:hypothetical protein
MRKFENELNLSLLMIYQIFSILPKNMSNQISKHEIPKIICFLQLNWMKVDSSESNKYNFKPEIKSKLNFMIFHWNKLSLNQFKDSKDTQKSGNIYFPTNFKN